MSDAPTQRFDAQPPAGSNGDKPKSRLPLVLIIIGGILLIVVILLIVLLLRGNKGTPQAVGTTTPAATPTQTTSPASSAAPSASPTPTPSASHTNAPPPPVQSTDAAFTKFNVQTAINSCSSGPYYTGSPPIVKVSWATIRADSAWIVQGTSDAANAQFMQIPLNGNQSDFQYEIDFSCGTPSSIYTITLVGSNGKHVSRSWKVKNTSPGQ